MISILYNCRKRIKLVGILVRGSIKGSKWIKKGKISLKTKETNVIWQVLTYTNCKTKPINEHCYHFYAKIYKKNYHQSLEWGLDFGHLGGQGGFRD